MKNLIYTVVTGMLSQTPYAGESYVSGGLRARGIFVQRHRKRDILSKIDPVGRELGGELQFKGGSTMSELLITFGIWTGTINL